MANTQTYPASGSKERIAEIARDGIKILRANSKNADFCVGSAWKTIELILAECGETVAPPPWRKEQP